MKISEEEVRHVARLARLDLAEKDVAVFSRQVGDILDYVDQLNAVDTQGVEGACQALSIHNAFREDKAVASMDPDLVLSNAPEREDADIIVPKVL